MIFLLLTFTFEPEAVMLTDFNDFFLKCLHSVCFIFIGCPFFQSLFVSRTGSVLFGALFINDPASFLAAVNAHNQTVTHSAASLNSPARLTPPTPPPLFIRLSWSEPGSVWDLAGTRAPRCADGPWALPRAGGPRRPPLRDEMPAAGILSSAAARQNLRCRAAPPLRSGRV